MPVSGICWLSCAIGPVCPSFSTRDLIEVHSSLGQTSALHVFSLTTFISLVYGQRNPNRTSKKAKNLDILDLGFHMTTL